MSSLPDEKPLSPKAHAMSPTSENVLHDSQYWRLTRAGDGSVLMRRTEMPFPSIEGAIAEFAKVVRVLRSDAMFTGGLVVNGKAIQGRNDSEYESAVKPYLDQLVLMARRVGFVMHTAPGTLQVRRLSGQLATPIEFFSEEPSALAFVAPRLGEPRTGWALAKPRR